MTEKEYFEHVKAIYEEEILTDENYKTVTFEEFFNDYALRDREEIERWFRQLDKETAMYFIAIDYSVPLIMVKRIMEMWGL